MAKTVAEIDGDSSGLVSALDKGKVGMEKLEAEGKKLTDQLRDVADQADVAAGALVNKIGGPAAIKAMAGVGAAFAAAETALGAFSSSMSAFASTQGAAGAKAMADLDTAVSELQGQLFTAVMGTDDMETAMDTLIPIVQGLTTAFQLLLAPVTAFSGFIRDMATDHSAAATQAREHAKAETEYNTALNASNIQMKSAHEGYASVERSIIGLIGTKREMAIFDLEETQRQYQAIILQQDRAMQARRLAQGDFAAAQAESAKRAELVDAEAAKLQATEDKLERAGKEGRRGRSADQIREIAEARVERDKNAQLVLDSVRQQARRESDTRLTTQELGFKEERDRLVAAQRRIEEMKAKLESAPETVSRIRNRTAPAGAAGGEPVAVEETAEAKMYREMGEYMEKARIEQEAAAAKAYADGIAAEVAMFRAGEAEKEAIKLAAKEKEDALLQERLKYVQDLAGQEMGIYMQNAAKQLAIGKLSAKAASDMARSALGNMIIGQGDKAMAEAGIMAASLNPLAIPMAAAGLAAYAIGNAMMPTVKPTAGSTPATEKPTDGGQAASNNYSFNMRVDSVFADGESVARQFAMMQESARARGLLMQGA
jgi:hypothetical protein